MEEIQIKATKPKKLTDKQKLMAALEAGDSAAALAIVKKPKRKRVREVGGNAKSVREYVGVMKRKIFDPFDLRELVQVQQFINGVVDEAVEKLKETFSWEEIGEGIGMTKQGCWERFGSYAKKRSKMNKARRVEQKPDAWADSLAPETQKELVRR